MQNEHHQDLTESTTSEVVPKKSLRKSSRRRAVIKGSAAVVGGVAASAYVTPTIRRLGVPVALATSGGTPPPPPPPPPPPTVGLGCTPGFWGNAPWGINLWNTANDIDWKHAGGAVTHNPYVTTTQFDTFFAAVPGQTAVNASQMYDLVTTGGGSNPVQQAARDLVAAYLNASFFGSGFPISTASLLSDWNNAVQAYVASGLTDTSAFTALHNLLDPLNNGTCKITKPPHTS